MIKSITTKHLFDIVFFNPQKMFEVRLLVSKFFLATHFIYFNGKSFYDEGIDGEKRKISKEQFFKNYQNNYWLIDNML